MISIGYDIHREVCGSIPHGCEILKFFWSRFVLEEFVFTCFERASSGHTKRFLHVNIFVLYSQFSSWFNNALLIP